MSCLDMERENTKNVIKMNAEVGKNGHSPYIDDVTQTWFVFDDISRKYVDTNIKPRGINTWGDIEGKPEAFPPSEHNHDDRYYTAQDIDMQIQNLGQDVDIQIQNLRNEIPSLNGYATESWIESKGYTTSQDVDWLVESKGYVTKESLDKQYELIEEITLSENVDNITRTTDTQGNAYNFKSVIIYAQFSANTENSTILVYVNGLSNVSIWGQNAISTAVRYDRMVIDCNGGVISGININAIKVSGTTNITSTPLLAFGHNAITSINIVSTKGIPSGSTIQIYGVRA